MKRLDILSLPPSSAGALAAAADRRARQGGPGEVADEDDVRVLRESAARRRADAHPDPALPSSGDADRAS